MDRTSTIPCVYKDHLVGALVGKSVPIRSASLIVSAGSLRCSESPQTHLVRCGTRKWVGDRVVVVRVLRGRIFRAERFIIPPFRFWSRVIGVGGGGAALWITSDGVQWR